MSRWAQQLPGLKSGKVYIFPTKSGFLFLVGTAVVILTGATYNNNLVFLLGFFLFAIFIISMVETHNNLRGLCLEESPIPDQMAGSPISVPIRLMNQSNASRQMVEFYPADHRLQYGERRVIEEVKSQSSQVYSFVCAPFSRGVHAVPKVVVSTIFPLGLFRSWMVLRASGRIIVYPHPSGQIPLRPIASDHEAKEELSAIGAQRGNDFREHRRYVSGESFHRLDWKVFARRRRLMIKEFEGTSDQRFSLRYNDVPQKDVELILSQLSKWLDLAKEKKAPFELILPTETIPFGVGQHHYQRCQRELARFEVAI